MGKELAQSGEVLLYSNGGEKEFVSVVFRDETFWLTQKAMAELFDVKTPAINKHLQNIYEDEELDRAATISKMETVQNEGGRSVRRTVDFYNLDAIIAVGYRVNSKKATRFRQWATKTLKEYITKGFVLNDELMKNGRPFGRDYFDELLERIREIRASERRAYQKIADIFEQCSYDYDKNSESTKIFYTAVWNNLLPEPGKAEDYQNQTIFSKMIDFAENAAENGELLHMENWLDILNNCTGRGKG